MRAVAQKKRRVRKRASDAAVFKILFDRQLLIGVLIKEQFHTNAVQTGLQSAAGLLLEPLKKL